MKTFLVLLISIFSFMCLAESKNKEIRLVNINGIVLVSQNKEYKVATNNQLLQVKDRVLVTKNSTGEILYKDDCVVNIPEYSIVDVHDSCDVTKNAISSLDSTIKNTWVKPVVILAGLTTITAVIYHIYHKNDNNDNNISLE